MSETEIENEANSIGIEEVELEVKPVKGESDENFEDYTRILLNVKGLEGGERFFDIA